MSMPRSVEFSFDDDQESSSSAGTSSFLTLVSSDRQATRRRRGRLRSQDGIGEVSLFSRLQAAEMRLVLETRDGANMDSSQISEHRACAARGSELSDPANHTSNGHIYQSVSTRPQHTVCAPKASYSSASASGSGHSSINEREKTTTPRQDDHPRLRGEEMRNAKLLIQLKEEEAAATRARDDCTMAEDELKSAEVAQEALRLDLTHSRDQTDDLRDQIAGLKAVQALQHNIIEKQSSDTRDRKHAMDETLKQPSVSDSMQQERSELMKEAFALVRSSAALAKRQAAMKMIAEVRAAEHTLQDATTRLRLLLQGIIETRSTGPFRDPSPHKSSSTKLDSISEDAAFETASTASSDNIKGAGSTSSEVLHVDCGPASHTSGIVLAAVAQQLQEHSREVSMARQEARDAADKMDQDMVEELAAAQSKAARLQGKLDSSNATIERYALEAKDHQSHMQSKEKELLGSEMKLEEQMAEWKDPQCEKLQEKLLATVQSSKLACGRADDFRQEIESLNARHARDVETLERELSIVRVAQALAGQSGNSSASMLMDLHEQVRHLTEERNELQNKLECQEIHWRTKVEELEMQVVMQRKASTVLSTNIFEED